MRYAKPLIVMLAAALACGACATSTVPTPNAGCSTLLAEDAAEPTPSAPFPAVAADATVEEELVEEQVFGVRQTGQLQIANSDKRYIVTTIRKCEERDAAAYRRINAPAWQFWR